MLKSIWERVELFGYKPTEHVLYWIGIWCLLGIGLVYVVIYYIAQTTGNQSLLQCKMKVFFGIPCPGCGGTRALWNLCHGRILKAIYYNAFAVYSAVWCGVYFVSQTIKRILACFGRQINGMKFYDSLLYIAIAVLIVQYLLKLFVQSYQV